jgi:predicted nucleic acid-binding protein
MIVVDDSAWVRSLVDGGPAGNAARRALTGDPDWAAPAHMPVEVLRTLRRYESGNILTSVQADLFAAEVAGATLRYALPEPWLLAAVWARRHNVSPYDAGYLALAEQYDAPLVTLDERLAKAAEQAGIDAVVPKPEPDGDHG